MELQVAIDYEVSDKHFRQVAGIGDIEFTPTDLGLATAAVRLLSASRGWRRNVRIVSGATPESRQSAETLVGVLTRVSAVPASLEEGGYWSKVGCELVDPNGTVAFVNAVHNSYFAHAVPSGQDGQIWKIQKCNPLCYLMTVPPQAARSPQELLLPPEVVEKDRLW